MRSVLPLVALLFAACASAPPAAEPVTAPKGTIADRTGGATNMPGFLPLHWNENEGKLLLEIPGPRLELIYQVSLATGVGSNPIGLDRGQMGDTYLVRFERAGPRMLMVQPNQRYRAIGGSPGEARAVEESFAASILWSFPIEAEEGERVLVDATSFFLRDAHGVAQRLSASNQGSYRIDPERSAIYSPRTRSFPKNTEVEATITLTTTDRPGSLVRSVAPTPEIVTVRQHHSFVELPAPGYEPRAYDPRTGFFGIEIYDYSSPIDAPLEKRFIARHRLEKKDPSAAMSEPVEPIVYYVDHAIPEPIRSALLEGASWWNEAFEAAGYRDAFQVRILPEDADPMDIRYNVINWVHRSTRGWSYGAAIVDPRTGEIIKGNVSLGSLRIRQDIALASGLIPPYEGPDPSVIASLDPSVSPTAMALARIRQLSAHEVGHTLGIAHNFAASSYDRGSVMDYPAPLVRIVDGRLDLSDAYDSGIGAFDAFVIRYGYSDFADRSTEERQLRAIVHEGLLGGMLFVADEHARDAGSAHPLGAVWDNGSDPIAMLHHEIDVRRIALNDFGLAALRPGQPLSELEPLLLPLYLHHRYQLEAALKSLGGVFFTYSVREPSLGSEMAPTPVRVVVDPSRQRAALEAAMSTLEPEFLEIPQRIIDLIPPTATGFESGTAERFERATGAVFDPVAAARASAAITLNALLHPARSARLLRFHSEERANPSLTEVVSAVAKTITTGVRESERRAALRRGVREVAVARLIEVARDPATDASVRAVYEDALHRMADEWSRARGTSVEDAHRRGLAGEITRFLERQFVAPEPVPMPAIPPG
ncbi:MAG: zinc-dependent metalloprotease, partial [Thermoanaerobaculia bacterium]